MKICSFCGKPRDKDYVQSNTIPSLIICVDCIKCGHKIVHDKDCDDRKVIYMGAYKSYKMQKDKGIAPNNEGDYGDDAA